MKLFRGFGRVRRPITTVHESPPAEASSTTSAIIQSYAATFDSSGDPVTITDKDGVIRYANDAFRDLTGFSLEELAGKTPRILKSGRHDGSFYWELWSRLLAGQVWHGDIINKRRDGSVYIDEQTITPIVNSNGDIDCFIAVRRDATRKRESERELIQGAEEQEFPKQLEVLLVNSRTKEEILTGALSLLMTLHEFQAHARGVAFEVFPEQGVLRMISSYGQFSPEFLREEAILPLGACLCGKAAQNGQVLICSSCFTDERHENKWVGMKAHGHYTIPLRTQNRVLAVINLYTDIGVDRSERRVAFFASIGFRLGAALARLRHDSDNN